MVQARAVLQRDVVVCIPLSTSLRKNIFTREGIVKCVRESKKTGLEESKEKNDMKGCLCPPEAEFNTAWPLSWHRPLNRTFGGANPSKRAAVRLRYT